MTAKGEIFDIQKLCPPPAAAGAEFANRFSNAVSHLPQGLSRTAGYLTGALPAAPGRANRGSQQGQVPLDRTGLPPQAWEELDALVQEGRESFEVLDRLLQNAPAQTGEDLWKCVMADAPRNYVKIRVAAQAMRGATLVALHRNNLPEAVAHLRALAGFRRLYENDPTLVNYMIRVAIIGLYVDACWDALQSGDWTESQLAALQQDSDTALFLARMPAALEFERAGRILATRQFAAHSYNDWLRRFDELYQSFGMGSLTNLAATPAGVWRQTVTHPLWQFAWVDQEELAYLREVQSEIEALRLGVEERSWVRMNQRLTYEQQHYHPPPASWRLYLQLPYTDVFATPISATPKRPAGYPYPDFSKAWKTTMVNLTWNEMTRTVLALKRFKLSRGEWPHALAELVPVYLSNLPVDLMDGKPLRYRAEPPGSFTLYSVGIDGYDDGGDAQEASASTQPPTYSFGGGGRDLVWPRIAAPPAVTHTATSATTGPPILTAAGPVPSH